MNALQKKQHALFKRRVKKLGFTGPELAILLGKTARMVNYYVNEGRRIPPGVWVKLSAIEKTRKETLWQRIESARQKQKVGGRQSST